MRISLSTLLLFVTFLAVSTQAYSSDQEIDSLKTELKTHPKQDTVRVRLLNELAQANCNKDISTALGYIDEAEKIADAIGFKKGKAKSLYLRGITHLLRSNNDEALAYFQSSIDLNKTIKNKVGISSCYNAMGIVYYYMGDQEQSIAFYKKSLQIDQEIGTLKDISISLVNLGSAYSELGNYDEAISYYKRALVLKIKLKDQKGKSSCYINIGTVYADQGNDPLAIKYYYKALAIDKELKDLSGIAKCYNNIGIIHKNRGDYDKAIAFYKKSLKVQQQEGNKNGISVIYSNLGNLYKKKNQLDLALNYLKDALKISNAINNQSQSALCLNNIGDVYLKKKEYALAKQHYEEAKEINLEIGRQLGLCNSYLGIASVYTQQKKYTEALSNALKSKAIADELELLSFQSDVAELLSEIYANLGNFKMALESQKQYKRYSDSLFNEEKIKKITNLEYEFKYKKVLEAGKNRELKLTTTVKSTSQDLEKSKQNTLWTIIIFLLVSMLLGMIIFYLKFRNAKAKTQNIIVEQKLLRSQMTPHFIFNSLSVLQGMILNKEESKSVSYLSKFSRLLRIILENSRDKTVSLAQELVAIESYLALHNLENDAYNFKMIVDPSVDSSALKIPPMLIQPFIENALEHAFVNQKENKTIEIHITLVGGALICTILDNGVGIDAQKENTREDKKSLATTITSERLKILSKDYNMKGSVRIENRQQFGEQGTKVTLQIPYKIQSAS